MNKTRGYDIALELLNNMDDGYRVSGRESTAIQLAISVINKDYAKADEFAHQLEIIDKLNP